MATDLETQPTTSKSEAYLQGKFADLCARIKRVDLVAHLLALSLAILCYALFVGLFDWFAGNSTDAAVTATRWIGFGGFVLLVGFLLARATHCALRRVNPYFVAHQLEATLPDAKNSLINWLDLQNVAMPSAFQNTLSTRAAEHFEACDTERPIKKRQNWIMLGCLAAPMLGLIVIAILNPLAFGSSMLRAFAPFYTPAPIARTRITNVQPGDAEVNPTQAIAITARIEGRRDAPTLSYRYHASEDYLTQPLQAGGAGTWTANLQPAQLRTGFTYKISAGDAETPEYRVRVRTRTHVAKFALTYVHPPYRKLPTGPFVFPNDKETKPIIRGPRGSEVEVVIHTSRPMQPPSVEIKLANTETKAEIRKLAEDAFSFRLKLAQSGKFRVLFTSVDGEENGDRDWYTIDVADDDAPKVVLTTPGRDVEVPENGTLIIEGLATSGVGLKNLTLHLRDLTTSIPLLPKVYRPDVSFHLDDGAYPGEIAYVDVLDLKQLKKSKETAIYLAPGTVIEYWLEATDCSDYQKPAGNGGKSSVYQIKLTPKATDDEIKRKMALDYKSKHDKKQDADLAKQKKDGKHRDHGGGQSQPNPQEPLRSAEKDKKDLENKIKDALKKENQDKQAGDAKGPQPPSAETKPEPSKSPDDPQPQKKGEGGMADDAGKGKEQGDGAPGNAKNDGEKSKDAGSDGQRKDGPKNTGSSAKGDGPTPRDLPAGGAKDAGLTGMNTPMPGAPKEPTPNEAGPMPTAKADMGTAKDGPPQASAKGIEQNGPDVPNKDQVSQDSPPNGQAKTGMKNDAGGDSKQGPLDQANQPGIARGNDAKTPSPERGLEDIANKLDQLPNKDAAADKFAKDLADIGKNSDDPRKSELAKEILKANGRDPMTGEKMKTKNPFGAGGPSSGISDELKTTIANREFAARIGQMQLDDWKKRMTPDLLKKAGMTDADWQRYLKAAQSYDALVRQLNAKELKDARQKAARATIPGSVRDIDSSATNSDPLDAIRGAAPPELRDAIQRFSTRKINKD